jgi:hypothetical protein
MFDLGPRCGFPLADLFESVTHLLRFRGREDVVGINQPPGLDEHAVGLLAKRHKVPRLQFYCTTIAASSVKPSAVCTARGSVPAATVAGITTLIWYKATSVGARP